ncbi:MAG TPA: lamin tail domain-containing protein, partial [Bacteroidales bacterium]|nr:lamin tail domain-containing protein [Bacteroidales bacterium]
MMPYLASAQVIDDFESGEISTWIQNEPGRWKGDTLNAISGSYSLHHIYDNPEAGTDRIAHAIRNLHPGEGTISWSFSLRHGYEPSSSNNWIVFLLSECAVENMTASSCSGGFAIGVNITGSDDSLRLVKIKNGVVTTILNTGVNWQTDIGSGAAAKITIERNVTGNWQVNVSKAAGSLLKSSFATDAELFAAAWFGVSYRYSSTKDRLLWIDDITMDGVFYADTVAPSLVKAVISGRNSIDLAFSEEPAKGSVSTSLFAMDSGEIASTVEVRDSRNFRIIFPSTFINKKINTLAISNICDSAGNCSGKMITEFSPVWAEKGDVIISEIMPDPVPSVSLPEKEYVELTNRTIYGYDLKNWKLWSGGQSYRFLKGYLGPGERMILCHNSDTSSFSVYGEVHGLSSFPALSSERGLVYVSDSLGLVIHGVEYSSDWYNNDLKSEGGWSLEMIDEDFPFFMEGNWTASSSRNGGTPGTMNSASGENRDISFFGIRNVFPEDSLHIMVEFSESLPAIPGNIKAGEIEAGEITVADPLFRKFRVSLASPLRIRKTYMLSARDLHDIAGNIIQNSDFVFGLTQQAQHGDILFNELLFNPSPGNYDYVELYNVSEKTLDASRLFLVSVDDATGDTSAMFGISSAKRCIMPSSYYTITENVAATSGSYPQGDSRSVFASDELPSMSDDEGHLLLLDRELDIIDEVRYNEKMHYPLLARNEGVSLEKTNPLLPSSEALNWHSAAEIAGWGTPGAQNSVFSEVPLSEEMVSLSATRITP